MRVLMARQFDEAKNYSDSICERSQKFSSPNDHLFCLILKALLESYQSYNYEGALKKFYEALSYMNENKGIDRKYYINVYAGLGDTYLISGDMPKAITNYNKALQHSEETTKYLYIEILSGLALSYTDIGDTAIALSYQKRLLALLVNSNEYDKRLTSTYDYHCLSNNVDSIVFYGQKILLLSKNHFLNTAVTKQLGITLLEKNDTVKSIKHLNSCIEEASLIGHNESIIEVSSILQDIYLNKEDSKKAYHYKLLIDSITKLSQPINVAKNLVDIKRDFDQKNLIRAATSKYKNWVYLSIFIIGLLLISGALGIIGVRKRWFLIEKNGSFRKFHVNPKIFEEIEEKMKQFYDQELFLDKNCSLTFVTEKLHIKNQRYLSEYIKTRFNKSFPNFINDNRFEYLKTHLMQLEGIGNLKIDVISNRLGFGSTRNFQNYILAKTGMPPKQFLTESTEKLHKN